MKIAKKKGSWQTRWSLSAAQKRSRLRLHRRTVSYCQYSHSGPYLESCLIFSQKREMCNGVSQGACRQQSSEISEFVKSHATDCGQYSVTRNGPSRPVRLVQMWLRQYAFGGKVGSVLVVSLGRAWIIIMADGAWHLQNKQVSFGFTA